MHSYIDEAIGRMDQNLYDKLVDQDGVISQHDRRLRAVEKRLGIPA